MSSSVLLGRFESPSPYAGRALLYTDGVVVIEGAGEVDPAAVAAVFADAGLVLASADIERWAEEYVALLSTAVRAVPATFPAEASGGNRGVNPMVAVLTGVALLACGLTQCAPMLGRADDETVIMMPDDSVLSPDEYEYRAKLTETHNRLSDAYGLFSNTESLDEALIGARAFEYIYQDMEGVRPPASMEVGHEQLMESLRSCAAGSAMLREGLGHDDLDSARTGAQMIVDGYEDAGLALGSLGL